MNIKFFLLPLFLSASYFSGGQSEYQEEQTSDKILWLTMEEAQEKSKLMPRKIMLFLYTDWCVWCRKMEESTFVDEVIADYINRSYYPVKFDAEEETSVRFHDRTYNFQEVKPRGVHGLAMELMDGRITYPTIAFLDKNWNQIQSIPNYHSKERFEQIITYFGEDYYKKSPWSSYQKSYIPLIERKRQ